MKLPFFTENKDKPEYYLALLLLDERVSAVILHSSEGKIKVVNKQEQAFPASIEHLNHEEFISTIDKAISTAEEMLPPNIETHKTVFGVKENWIEEETKKIKKEYLANLKKMCGELNLSPIGFMVISEAIAHYLQEEEGAPLSAIFVETGKKYANISLYRGGKVIEKASGELEDSAPATVDKLLRHFTVPVLPARIILFYADKGEKLTQQFISHQWSKSLPFLHMPQISILPEGFDAQAVTAGAAGQMGLEILDIGKHLVPEEISPEERHKKHHEAAATDIDEAINVHKEETKELEAEEPTHAVHMHHSDNLQHPTQLSKGDATDFGFVVDEDITDAKPHSHHAVHNEHVSHESSSHHESAMEEDVRMEEPDGDDHPRRKSSSFAIGGVGALLAPLKNIHFPSLGGLDGKRNLLKVIIPVGALLILFLVLTFVYFFKTKATVTLTVKPKMVEQSTQVTFSTTSPTDFSKNVIAAKSISTTVEGELSRDVTGKKDVGEKAKGTVTIFSRLSSSKTFSSGTTITANGHSYTLDKDVTVASSSADASSEPSKANVPVTASEIGAESNLPSGAKFTVKGFDLTDVVAKNDSAFSGGSKKSVTVVSKEDLAKLKTDLPKSLESKAREALIQKASGEETVLPIFLDINLDKTKFDKKEGDEVKKVTLKATVEFTSLSYRNEEFTEYAKSLLKNKYSQEIGFADKSVTGTVKTSKVKNENEADTTTAVKAGLLPTIETNDVKEKIKGQSLSQAKETVNNLPQVIKSQINFTPNIPFLPNLFPNLPSDIEVVVKSE